MPSPSSKPPSLSDNNNNKKPKPRHGINMTCKLCGWSFIAGGYETKKQLHEIEKAQKKVHTKAHRAIKLPPSDKTLTPARTLKVQKTFHAAELQHAIQQVTDRRTVTSNTYTEVTGINLSAATFTAGKKYLISVTAQVDNSSTSTSVQYRTVHGGVSWASDSTGGREPPNTSARYQYAWWTVWNAVSGEDISLLFRNSSATPNTAGIDNAVITVIKLSDDLVEDTDWKVSEIVTPTTLATTDSTANNAEVSITPSTANQPWLVMTKSRLDNSNTTSSTGSRLVRSGESSSTAPYISQYYKDTNDSLNHVLVRVFTLGNTSNTFTEKSFGSSTTGTRTASGVFLLNLAKLRNVEYSYDDTSITALTQHNTNLDTAHTNIATVNIQPAVTGDVWCYSQHSYVPTATALGHRLRMQVDGIDQPTGQTSDAAPNQVANNAADELPLNLQTVVSMSSSSSHAVEVDGSISTSGSGRGVRTKTLFAVTMELAAVTNPITKVIGELVGVTEQNRYSQALIAGSADDTVGVGETVVKVLLKAIAKPVSESVSVTENVVKIVTGALRKSAAESISITEQAIRLVQSALYIRPLDFELRFSGSGSNSNPDASLGGSMNSTVVGSVLFDNVSITEATSGDPTPDHRCVYIINKHPSLSMLSTYVWIQDNTPGDDYIEIAKGSSAIGASTIETAIANEGATPTISGSWSLTGSRASAILIGDIPAGHHAAIWLRRTVPAGTTTPVTNNRYTLMAECFTNHV